MNRHADGCHSGAWPGTDLDGHVFPEEGRTGIMAAREPAPGTGQPEVRFVGYLGINGSHPQDVMQPKFDVLLHGIKPVER